MAVQLLLGLQKARRKWLISCTFMLCDASIITLFNPYQHCNQYLIVPRDKQVNP